MDNQWKIATLVAISVPVIMVSVVYMTGMLDTPSSDRLTFTIVESGIVKPMIDTGSKTGDYIIKGELYNRADTPVRNIIITAVLTDTSTGVNQSVNTIVPMIEKNSMEPFEIRFTDVHTTSTYNATLSIRET